ncbi:MAG TPA: hypothetical protein PKE69_27710, partial [Pyrinomonadaceae bacterium]|nr:hypothetical protein [Pyrinomonadaceae bacterium]
SSNHLSFRGIAPLSAFSRAISARALSACSFPNRLSNLDIEVWFTLPKSKKLNIKKNSAPPKVQPLSEDGTEIQFAPPNGYFEMKKCAQQCVAAYLRQPQRSKANVAFLLL